MDTVQNNSAQNEQTVQTYRAFAQMYNCTEGALRSYTLNKYGKAAKMTDIIPTEILQALKGKYTRLQSNSVTPVPNAAPVSFPIKKEESSIISQKGQELPVCVPLTARSIAVNEAEKFISQIGIADMIIWITSGVTAYGLTCLFAEMGLILGILYTLTMLLILHMTKNAHSRQTAQMGIAFVYVMEAAAVFVHTSMFNLRIWANAQEMVFKPEHGSAVPFICAMSMGLFISAFSVFVLHVQLNKVAEANNAAQFEKEHGVKY